MLTPIEWALKCLRAFLSMIVAPAVMIVTIWAGSTAQINLVDAAVLASASVLMVLWGFRLMDNREVLGTATIVILGYLFINVIFNSKESVVMSISFWGMVKREHRKLGDLQPEDLVPWYWTKRFLRNVNDVLAYSVNNSINLSINF